MAAINVQARSFVSMIVNEYDQKFNADKEKKVPDVFNPSTRIQGVKERSLGIYLNKFSNPPTVGETAYSPPRPMTPAELDADVVSAYNDEASTISHLFALTGMLDAPLQNAKLQETKERIIAALAQDYLQKSKYEVDPMTLFSSITGAMAFYSNAEPTFQFSNGKRHFYSHIFQKVYRHSTVKNRKKIIAALKEFEPLLQSRSFWYQRGVFKVEGTINKAVRNKYVKAGACLSIGVGFYYLTTLKLIPLAVHFFNSNAFASTGVASYMPAVIVQISSGAYTGVVAVVAFVASTRIYVFFSSLGKLGPLVGTPALNFLGNKLWPNTIILREIGSYTFAPIFTSARKISFFMYERAFGPDIRAQMAISRTLANQVKKAKFTHAEAKILLDEGMKAYQIWMYLMEQGVQEGLLQPA